MDATDRTSRASQNLVIALAGLSAGARGGNHLLLALHPRRDQTQAGQLLDCIADDMRVFDIEHEANIRHSFRLVAVVGGVQNQHIDRR